VYILLYSDKQRSRFVLDAFQLKNAGPAATLHASFWDPSRKRSSNVNRVLPCDSGCFRHTSFWNVALLVWFSHYASKRLNIFESPISLCQCLLSPLFFVSNDLGYLGSKQTSEFPACCRAVVEFHTGIPAKKISRDESGRTSCICKRVANELRVSICQHD
jgi:hypothetical protein